MSRGPIKLSTAEVYAIREAYRPGCPENGRRALAERYGVHPYTIRDVVTGRTWSHV